MLSKLSSLFGTEKAKDKNNNKLSTEELNSKINQFLALHYTHSTLLMQHRVLAIKRWDLDKSRHDNQASNALWVKLGYEIQIINNDATELEDKMNHLKREILGESKAAFSRALKEAEDDYSYVESLFFPNKNKQDATMEIHAIYNMLSVQNTLPKEIIYLVLAYSNRYYDQKLFKAIAPANDNQTAVNDNKHNNDKENKKLLKK